MSEILTSIWYHEIEIGQQEKSSTFIWRRYDFMCHLSVFQSFSIKKKFLLNKN